VAQQTSKNPMSKRQKQISFLAQSSSILSKLATIIKANSTIFFTLPVETVSQSGSSPKNKIMLPD
jgi:hypothetical protein